MHTDQKGATMNGICGTCGREAGATRSNEGYSDCCNDRIEYGLEASETLARMRYERVLESGAAKIELLGSWGQVESEALLVGATTYYGKPAILFINENGHEGLKISDTEGQKYGWRRVSS
jgi:hypothetical protein